MDSKKIVNGLKWTTLQYAVETFFRFSIKLLLAKILFANEFGLIGMASVFIAVAGAASELGMSSALIQIKDDKIAEEKYPTAFWTGIFWGIFIFLIMTFIVAPLSASFYREPILSKLVPVLSLGILVKPLAMIHTVILTRVMNFKIIAKVNNIAAIVAGVIALVSAYFNFGVWSLAINNVLAVLLTIPLFFLFTKWKPILEWNKTHFNEIFGFGAYSTGTSVFGAIIYNIDNLMIGKFLGATMLGNYTLSFSLTEQLRQVVSNILNKVMYPVFGKFQHDKEKLQQYFLKVLYLNALIIFPIMFFFLIFAKKVILVFFGKDWELAIIPLQILSVAMMFHLLVNSFNSLIKAIGKPKLEMKIVIFLTLFVLIPALYIGIKYYGILGATYAILLNKVSWAIVGLIVLKNEIELPIYSVFKTIKWILLAVVISSFFVLFFDYYLEIHNFFVHSIIFFICYFVIVYKKEMSKINLILKKIM